MKSLPTLRRKILRSFLVLVGLYAALGGLLVASVKIAGQSTPTLVHVNYDSISAARKMSEAWTGLQFLDFAETGRSEDRIRQFEEALHFEEGNLTEVGEKELAARVRMNWEKAKSRLGRLGGAEFSEMRSILGRLIEVNEQGMFRIIHQNERLSEKVLWGTVLYLVLSLIVCLFFSDQLSQRLSLPLKSIAEALHRRPSMNRKLKLPDPTTLEVLILTTELQRLWDRLSATERVNIAEIVQEKSKLETLLESVDDGVLVVDARGRVLHCNEALARWIGLSREQVQGQTWVDLPTTNENYLLLRSSLQEGMSDLSSLELLQNGIPAFFSARSRKIEAGGAASGVFYLLHDVTEKKQRDQFRSDFIDLLSHELKTPLQSLGTASEILVARKGSLPTDLMSLVESISEDVERIKAVAQEFVQVTQSHSKILRLKLETVALNQLLPEWLKPFTWIAKDRNVRLEWKQEGSEAIWANLDLVKFPWVISNLVSNAIRFSPAGKQVLVILTDRNGSVEVQVKDEGPGVSEGEQARIFEPFYQSATSNAAGGRGLFGVGLTIAKEVIEAHDGRIEYHRLNPSGSEFRVLLPFPPVRY